MPILASAAAPCLASFALFACNGALPSEAVEQGLRLPEPGTELAAPVQSEPRELYDISAESLIRISFHEHPEIRSSYQRFLAEKARYDFFVASRDALTLGMRTAYSYGRSEQDVEFVGPIVDRTVEERVAGTLEKQFFDTTRLDMQVGYRRNQFNQSRGYRPFVGADLRYPLGPSREKLERTSEDIFRQNELNDAQLDYINVVRRELERALSQFYEVIDLGTQVDITADWREDLAVLKERIEEERSGASVESDLRRIAAEMTRVTAENRNVGGRHEIELARLKAASGLSYDSEFRLDDDGYNPFDGVQHDALRENAREVDPEIATLTNSLDNAHAQLDLARRGKWDIALLAGANADLEGGGVVDGSHAYGVSVGLDVGRVDARVTSSLERQALARIARFERAIEDREREIYVDTLEPLIRIETLGANRRELMENLDRFVQDFEAGVERYFAGNLNIDDLLKRRETLYQQEEEISELGRFVGINIAELMTATNKYFELVGS